MLHGAFGSKQDLVQLANCLKSVECILLDLPFHDQNSTKIFTYQNLISNLEEKLKTIHYDFIFGYSMGGYLALDLALKHKIKPQKIITYGTKFQWNQNIIDSIKKVMNPSDLKIRLPQYTLELEKNFGPYWADLIQSTFELMEYISNNPLTIDSGNMLMTSVQCIVGSKDKLVSIEETKLFFSTLPQVELCSLENGYHELTKSNLQQLSGIIGF